MKSNFTPDYLRQAGIVVPALDAPQSDVDMFADRIIEFVPNISPDFAAFAARTIMVDKVVHPFEGDTHAS